MKKACGVFPAAMLIALMTTCGNTSLPDNGVNANHSGNVLPENFIMLDTEGWPRSEYTASIPQLELGTLLCGWTDPDQEYCYPELSDTTQLKSEQYTKTLEESGLSEVKKVLEEINNDYIPMGTLLTKDNTIISISYTNDPFGMYIKSEQQQLKYVLEYLLPRAV